MNPSTNAAQVADKIAASEIWQYETGFHQRVGDVANATRNALRAPTDFPPLTAAIAPGDQIALAVDPNVPDLCNVIRGVLLELEQADAETIDIVLWDETSDEIQKQLESEFETIAHVIRHDSQKRDLLRYLGADVDADPIYLNRFLADADLVLPILAARPGDAVGDNELSGVYPMLADSNTRMRHQKSLLQPATKKKTSNESHVGWMLGVQVMVAVAVNPDGDVGGVFAGTPEATRRWFERPRHNDDDFPPSASLVIATLEGTKQQNSWANLARAVTAAATHTEPGGTIVLWSQIDDSPSDRLVLRLSSDRELDELEHDDPQDSAEELGDQSLLGKSEDGFTIWDDSIAIADAIDRVRSEYRVLLHSKLGTEVAESLGLGAIESLDALQHLSKSFDSCGILRAAQYAGSTFDLPVTESDSE
ncbi:lactate racemase domain-containing protein [Novipirellula caenicola]|uniref:lactate racemase domain-containing protein n=1 Tax=Novipirellula caenicola TaxID=1536901 RepID=UPI0031E7B06E